MGVKNVESYSIWKDVYGLIERGCAIEHIVEPSRAVFLFDAKAGDRHYLVMQSDAAWSNVVRLEIEEILRHVRFDEKAKRKQLIVHIHGQEPVDMDRMSEVAQALRIESVHWLPVEQSDDETDYRKAAIELDQGRKNEVRRRFSFGTARVVYVFLLLCFLVMYVAESVGSTLTVDTLVRFGAKVNELIDEGEWWRLVTPMFLHIGWFHFGINMFALWSLGPLVERMYASTRFAVIFLLSGIAASLASYAFSDAISAGASGALFGLVGALLYFGLRDRKLFMKTLGPPLFIMIGLNGGLALIAGASLDHAAHLGGLFAGFLVSGMVGLPDDHSWKRRILFGVAFVVCVTALYWIGAYR